MTLTASKSKDQTKDSAVPYFSSRAYALVYHDSSLACMGYVLNNFEKTGLLIFRGKIGRFRGIFAGKKIKIRGTIGRFQAIFAGEKSKFAGKSAHFEGF